MAPFGDGKKKAEFPDAFVISALTAWSTENDEPVYVISEDPDLRSVCGDDGPLIHVPSLAAFLELALRDEGFAIEAAHIRFHDVKRIVEEMAREEFEGRHMWLEDQDGEALEIRVSHLHLYPESVVSITETTAVFSLLARFHFEADIKYVDPDSVYSDSETQTEMYFRSIEATVERSLEVPIEVELSFSPDDLEDTSIDRVTVNSDESVRIWADEDAETHYK